MGPDEYFSLKWAVEDDLLHVKGTKRRGRDRLVVGPGRGYPEIFQ